MGWVARDLKAHLVPSPLPWAGTLDQVVQSPIIVEPAFQHSRRTKEQEPFTTLCNENTTWLREGDIQRIYALKLFLICSFFFSNSSNQMKRSSYKLYLWKVPIDASNCGQNQGLHHALCLIRSDQWTM